MEDSVSRTSTNMEHNLEVGNEFVRTFGSLGLGNDDHSSIHNSDVNVVNRPLTTEKTSDQTQSFLRGSKGKEIWENPSDHEMNNYCEGSSSNARGENYSFFSYDLYREEDNISKNLEVGSSSTRQTYYFPQSHSCNDPIILRAPMNPISGIETDELRSSNENHTMDNSSDQETAQFNAPQRSTLQIGSQGGEREFVRFQETLGNHNQTAWHPPTLFSQFQGCFLELMTDTSRNYLFEKLLDECNDEQLDSLVQEVLLGNTKSFLRAAFCKDGSISIRKLIKKIKKTDHAYMLTGVLSTDLYPLMIDSTARWVITHCLDQFGSRPNEVLYDNVILRHMDLAIDEVGCRSLNECIRTISGKQKITLLESIADGAVFLSNDRYGNYVVQQAMIYGHVNVTAKILFHLRGHFTQLSQEQVGSHVVERCVNSSRLGTELVVKEILQTQWAPFQLARHQFGNYVIQALLRNLKRQGNETLYMYLVKCLEPHFPELQNAGGKQVVNLIISDINEIHFQHLAVNTN